MTLLSSLSSLIRKFDDVFGYIVSPPSLSRSRGFAWDAKAAELNIISFAVEWTAKGNSSSFIKVILYWNTSGYLFIRKDACFCFPPFLPCGILAQWNSALRTSLGGFHRAGLYLWGQRKAKKKQILCELCVSAVIINYPTIIRYRI